MDDKTRHLLDKSQQYLRSAAVLLEVGDYDSCVSRAYFAMFYAAQAALLATGASVKSRRSIRSAFVERFVENGRFPRRAGEVLHRAYDLQETADYAQRPVIEEDEAEQTLSHAEAFIGSIGDLMSQQRSSAAGNGAPARRPDRDESPAEETSSEEASAEKASAEDRSSEKAASEQSSPQA